MNKKNNFKKSGNVYIVNGSHPKKDSGWKPKSSEEQVNGLGSFLILLLMFIVVGNYLRTGMPYDLTFKSFIEYLSNAPSFDISWSMVDLTIYGDWGLFNFLKDIFNWFTDIWEVCITLFGMIIETIEFIFYFAKGLLFS